jgi:hypothetical protein
MFAADWHAILQNRPNVLLQGPKLSTDAWLSQLLACCRGSTLLENVHTYGLVEQTALLQWLDNSDRVQVISTTERPLFESVERGDFIGQLYYRLNTVFLDLSLPLDAPCSGVDLRSIGVN